MNEIVICVFITLVIVVFIIIRKNHNANKKKYSSIIEILSKNIEKLSNHEDLNYMKILKETSDMFSNGKDYNGNESSYNSQFNYMSFFKYNYKNDYISLDLLFTINNSGVVIDNFLLDDLTVTANIISSSILKSDDNLNYIFIDDIKSIKYNKSIYSIIKERDIYKIYLKKNYEDLEYAESDCLGFFYATYSDDYIISDNEEEVLSDVVSQVVELI